MVTVYKSYVLRNDCRSGDKTNYEDSGGISLSKLTQIQDRETLFSFLKIFNGPISSIWSAGISLIIELGVQYFLRKP